MVPSPPTSRGDSPAPDGLSGTGRRGPRAGLEALVARAREGDGEALDDLVRASYASLLATAFHLLGNREDAEDLVQESFVDAFGALDRLRRAADFEAWVRGILLHKVRDRFRRAGRGPAYVSDEALSTVGDTRGEGEARRREASRRLRRALEHLPVGLRLTICLRALDGRSYEEVARATGVTPATSRTRAVKARRMLLRLLAPWWEEGR